jgi:hypothetical protein
MTKSFCHNATFKTQLWIDEDETNSFLVYVCSECEEAA